MMELWEILVPASSNKGEFSYEHHKQWDSFVLGIAGGITVLKAGKGEWIHEGKSYKDRVIPVRVACSHEDIVKIIDFTLSHYKQKAVMAYRLSDNVIIQHSKEQSKDTLESLGIIAYGSRSGPVSREEMEPFIPVIKLASEVIKEESSFPS